MRNATKSPSGAGLGGVATDLDHSILLDVLDLTDESASVAVVTEISDMWFTPDRTHIGMCLERLKFSGVGRARKSLEQLQSLVHMVGITASQAHHVLDGRVVDAISQLDDILVGDGLGVARYDNWSALQRLGRKSQRQQRGNDEGLHDD